MKYLKFNVKFPTSNNVTYHRNNIHSQYIFIQLESCPWDFVKCVFIHEQNAFSGIQKKTQISATKSVRSLQNV